MSAKQLPSTTWWLIMSRRKKGDWSGPVWKIWPLPSIRYAVEAAAQREGCAVGEMVIRLVTAELHRRAGTAQPVPATTPH
jgi:hypothetical protein